MAGEGEMKGGMRCVSCFFAASGRCRLQENIVCEVRKEAEQSSEVNLELGEVLKMADC